MEEMCEADGDMKPNPNLQTNRTQSTARAGGTAMPSLHTEHIHDDFAEDEAEPTPVVEHATVPGFMRDVAMATSTRWHMDDLSRFGDKLGRVAEAMQIAYVTAVDRSLGVIRVFPLPLLRKVYGTMARQFNWPIFPETLALPSNQDSETLGSHARLYQMLKDLEPLAPDISVRGSIGVVLGFLERDAERLRAAAAATA